jgi:hypothetical protein
MLHARTVTIVLATALMLQCETASAQSGTCTPVTSVPTTITNPGVYCLTGNLDLTQSFTAAITVNSRAVVLDFNGYRLRWAGSGTTTYPGVQVLDNKNVTIRNGSISSFGIGVVTIGQGTIVEDMRLNDNDLGVRIWIGGAGAIIRRNYFRGGNGIEVVGSNNPAEPAVSEAVRIIDNDIHGPQREPNGPGFNGMNLQGKDAFVVGNRLSRLYSGIWFDALRQATGKYRDNIVSDTDVPYTGGTNIGNND